MFNFHFIKSNFKYLLFGFLMTFCSSFGQTFFLGIFNPFIREDLNLSHSEFGGIYSIATLVSSLTIIWLGKKIDDFKLRNFAVFVCLSLFSAAVFMSQLSGYIHLIFAIFFLRLFGQGLMSHTSSTSMAKIFNKNNLRYTNCSDEHGIIEDYNNSLKLNDKLKLIPGHCDPTCNLHDWYVVIDKNGKVKDLWEVSARGFSF